MEYIKQYNTNEVYVNKKLAQKINKINSYKLTVVEAPMGYGKTTAIKIYLNKFHTNYYWQNIYSDSDIAFWQGFCRIISKMDKNAGSCLKNIGLPKDNIMLEECIELINSIYIKEETAIILDDYHLIDNKNLDELFYNLVKSMDSKIHLIIITRNTPDIELEELKLKKLVNYITKDYLEFDKDDIKKYYKLCGIDLNSLNTNDVYKKSEGWISVIYLLMLNYIEFNTIEISENIYELVEKLVYEPFEDRFKDFLLRLCVFDQFTLEQVKFVTDDEDVDFLIKELTQVNAFVKYDKKNKVYLFHAIFRTCLLEKLKEKDDDYKKEVYKKGGLWFYKKGKYVLSMDYFYKAGDYESFLNTLVQDKGNSITGEIKDRFIECMENCPNEFKQKNHLALLVYARRLFTYNEMKLFGKVCDQFYENLANDKNIDDKERNQLIGEMKLILSFTKHNNIEAMLCLHKEACELMYKPSTIMTNKSTWTFGSPSVLYMYYREKGKLQEQVKIMRSAMPYYYKITENHGKGADYIMEAEVCFNQGDILNAEIALGKAMLECDRYSGILCCALFLKLRIFIYKGMYEEFLTLMEEIEDKIYINELHMFSDTLDLIRAYIYSNLKEESKIPKWIANGKFENTRLLFPTMPLVNFVYTKVLISKKEYVKVVALYDKNIAMARIYPTLLCEIFENIHLSIAYYNLGKKEDAIKKLEDALEIGMSDKLYMIFAENYEDIQKLLDEIYQNGNFKKEIDEIRKLKKPYVEFLKIVKKQQSKLIMLSEREMEVAKLAAQGFTNNEIAQILFLSVNTVKTILKTVFKKLCIKSRHEIKDVLKIQNSK
ncbi:helix-turn-helix transcriptional regulator [Intestinibacter bartlettii]|uniref:LuxR C-terminal-related transcriptional regulator n=1 Tax=Intestinibacter bartlettii TaxID=261299 RepID=A0ABS6DUE6_9FIRM|nr:LuxR C-terminal-related transcriptional regulator [Intestinibacter bartlettii]MBU5335441.1 LuxR C-terminal-related transcriptional regulator [Intestinibacter bartlettii]